jgi:hypothetical protein
VLKHSFPVCIWEGSKGSVRRHFFSEGKKREGTFFGARVSQDLERIQIKFYYATYALISEYETALHRPRPFNLLCDTRLNSPQLLARSRELNISPDGAVFCSRDSIVDEVHHRDSPSKKSIPEQK